MRKEIALIAELVNKAREAPLGRTALMKCLYLLKTTRNVPLDYHFQLYNYGPFDQNVLDDLSYSESLGAVKSDLIFYPGGYGYELKTGQKMQTVKQFAQDFISKYHKDVEWVVKEFANRTASDLEMLSTIVYVDRSIKEKGNALSEDYITSKVRDIKPHFDVDKIREGVKELKNKGLLVATA